MDLNLTDIFKVLSDEKRLRIINILFNNELCVCEIEVILELNQSSVSRHLRKIKTTSILNSSKDAQWIHYKVNKKFIKDNSLLINYLENNFSKNKIYRNDLERLRKYKEHNLNCKIISEDREQVENLIR